MADETTIARLAALAVELGANVQEGQIVGVTAEPGHAPLVRAIAEAAYRRGARLVDVAYFDPWVRRARIEHAPDETLGFVPSWWPERLLGLAAERSASISVAGSEAAAAVDGLDPVRAGRARFPTLDEGSRIVSERLLNWTAVPFATRTWARQVHPTLHGEAAEARLWEQLVYVCRLDAPDPVAAWRARIDETSRVAAALDALRLDALHLEGPGTDLTIGLLPTSKWLNVEFATAYGLRHVPNIPSEEVFTTPDPERADGVVRATRPLVLQGMVITDLEVRFEHGRAVEIGSSSGGEALRAHVAVDDGGSRLGEVALVDREGRVGRAATTFYNTLLDENAAGHLALGNGFAFAVDEPERGRINRSASHVDFMVGDNDVAVTGVMPDSRRVPLLRDGTWQV